MLAYLYPKYQESSFHFLAKKHIEIISKYHKVLEYSLEWLGLPYPPRNSNIIFHPIFYSLFDHPNHFKEFLRIKRRLGGFEVLDSDRLSERALDILESFDLIIVPSKWNFETLKLLGVEASIERFPHGVEDYFFENNIEIKNPFLRALKKFKEENNIKLILFDLRHSGFRKGADIVYDAMKNVQKERKDAVLLIKRFREQDPYLGRLKELIHVDFDRLLKVEEMAQLYSLADITIVPSRGGGFELMALESLAVGTPTLVTEKGPFEDYIEFAIPIRVYRLVKVFSDDEIHVGLGYEADPEDLAKKILNVLDNWETFKEKFLSQRGQIRERFSWQVLEPKLIEILREHDFLAL